MILEERSRDIGKFIVGRLLPFPQKRQVGPFTFIDHMGPSTIGPDHYLDVDQHPHIGLSTLTYLYEGEIEHKDSTGAVQVITPGDVGFMTSGSGVTHTERTPKHLRKGSYQAHGYQIWVALPKELESMEPNFQYLSKEQIPTTTTDGLQIKLIAGSGFGMTSPLKTYSPLFMVDIFSENVTQLDLKDQLEGEIAFVVVQGEVSDNDHSITAGQVLISKTENECCINFEANTRVLIFGGQPFDEPRYLHWNFVSSSKETLEQAKEDWKNKKFPKVPGDETYIPIP